MKTDRHIDGIISVVLKPLHYTTNDEVKRMGRSRHLSDNMRSLYKNEARRRKLV